MQRRTIMFWAVVYIVALMGVAYQFAWARRPLFTPTDTTITAANADDLMIVGQIDFTKSSYRARFVGDDLLIPTDAGIEVLSSEQGRWRGRILYTITSPLDVGFVAAFCNSNPSVSHWTHSRDGRYVAVRFTRTDFCAGESSGQSDTFVWDLQAARRVDLPDTLYSPLGFVGEAPVLVVQDAADNLSAYDLTDGTYETISTLDVGYWLHIGRNAIYLQARNSPTVWRIDPDLTLTAAFALDGVSYGPMSNDASMVLYRNDSAIGVLFVATGEQWVIDGGRTVLAQRGAAFSPDDRYLVLSDPDGSVRLYDTTTRDLIQTLHSVDNTRRMWGVAFGAKGDVIFGVRDHAFVAWGLDGQPLASLELDYVFSNNLFMRDDGAVLITDRGYVIGVRPE